MDKYIIGLDIGGTSVKVGLLNDNGDIIHKWQIPTNKKEKGFYIVEDIWRNITNELAVLQIQKSEISGVGVGAPGFVDNKSGLVYEAVNIGWKNFKLAEELQRQSNLPVFIENDANMAVLGENWKGAGNQARDIIAITLGTGVGSGIIANGGILNGTNGTAGEIGHIIVDPNGYLCNCGRVGCLDTIASATGIVRQAMDKIKVNPNSVLAEFYHENGVINAKDVFDLAGKGDQTCEQIINRIADILGMIITNAATVINPSRILIGGGVSKAGDQLLHLITKYFQKYALPRISNACEIKIAELGNDAGIIGAAYLVKMKLNISEMDSSVNLSST